MTATTHEAAPESTEPRVAGIRAEQLARCGWAALAGAAVAAAFPPYHLPALMPFGIAGLIHVLRNTTKREAFYAGLCYGVACFLLTLFWLFNVFGLPSISLIAIASFFPALFALFYSWLTARYVKWPVWLLAPIAWVGVEYYRSELFALNFGWIGLGYGVVNSGPLAGMASVVGSYGVSFLIVMTAAILTLLARKADRSRWMNALVVTALWLGLVYWPSSDRQPNRPLRVRLVQADAEDVEAFVSLSEPEPGNPVDVIVWPEYSFVSDPSRQPKLWGKLQSVARENRAHFIFGAEDQFDTSNPNGYRNTAFVLDPEGRCIGKHVKNHLVHFVRDGKKGTEAKAIPTTLGRLGVGICFDMDYPDVARRLVTDGAEVLLVPNMDPKEWGPVQQAQHRLMFQMRAAETGRWLARADVAGGTSVAAPNGREVARVRTSASAKLEAVVGRETGQTWFLRGGWRFGQACFAALMALWLFGLIFKPPALITYDTSQANNGQPTQG
jgi:apolipoprotein N-acyltransferase